MTLTPFGRFLFLTTCISYLFQGNLAAKLDISPSQHYVTKSTSVDITCSPDEKESDFFEPVLLQIIGSTGNVIVSLFKDEKIILGDNFPSRYSASGTISMASLTLTIKEPEQKDFGNYICRLTYMNLSKKVATHDGNGKLDENDIRSVFSTQMDKVMTRVSSLEATVKELSRKQNTKSAFVAITKDHLAVEVGEKIKFPDVQMTHGLQGYDISTGIYTVPADGLYLFNLLISLNCQNCHIIGYLMVNNVRKAGFGAHDLNYFDQTSVSITESLKKGDQVYAVPSSKHEDAKVGYRGFSSFGGILLEAF